MKGKSAGVPVWSLFVPFLVAGAVIGFVGWSPREIRSVGELMHERAPLIDVERSFLEGAVQALDLGPGQSAMSLNFSWVLLLLPLCLLLAFYLGERSK